MRALSLLQPWAQLVVDGEKRIETRSWKTRYRGRLWIHASKRSDPVGRELAQGDIVFREALGREFWKCLPRGAIIGAAMLVDCVPTEQATAEWMAQFGVDDAPRQRRFGDFRPGRFAFALKSPLRLSKPLPYKGALQLWRPGALDQPDIPRRVWEELMQHGLGGAP